MRCIFATIAVFLLSTAQDSDGLRCNTDSSASNVYQCNDGHCISFTFVCDGDNDCSDRSDETLCRTSLSDDNFLIVTDNNNLYQIGIGAQRGAGGNFFRLLPSSGARPRRPYGLALDAEHNVLYWTDMATGCVMSLSLPPRRRPTDPVFRLGSPAVVLNATRPGFGIDVLLSGIAVDAVGNKLYYCDEGAEPMIGEVSLGAERPVVGRVVFTERGMKPRAVAFYDSSDTRYVYWTDYGDHAAINRISLRPGSGKQSIAWRNVERPYGLAVDAVERTIYWVDGRLGRVERCDLDGSNRQLLHVDEAARFTAISLSERYVLLTDLSQQSVRRLDRRTNQIADQPPRLSSLLAGIVHFNSTEYAMTSSLLAMTSPPSTTTTTTTTTPTTTETTTTTTTTTKTTTQTTPTTPSSAIAMRTVTSRPRRPRTSTTSMVPPTAEKATVAIKQQQQQQQQEPFTGGSSAPDDTDDDDDSMETQPTTQRRRASPGPPVADQQAAAGELRDKDGSGSLQSVVLIAVVGLVLVVAIVTIGVVCVCIKVRRNHQVVVGPAKGSSDGKPSTCGGPRPVSTNYRQTNVYDYPATPVGGKRATYAEATGVYADTYDEIDYPKLALQQPRPKAGVPNKAGVSELDCDGYMVPSLPLVQAAETDGDSAVDVYDSIEDFEDTYLHPCEDC